VTYERVYSHNYGRDVGFIEEYEDTCENCGGTGQIEDDEAAAMAFWRKTDG
jgi:Ribonuclease G/E